MIAGTQVGGYRLVQPIGEGGMGVVWLAEHMVLGRRAAIKVLHASYGAREEVVTRFFNEARAATAINDPGIVQIFDFGHHTDGSAYIVMELLDGETLHARIQREGPMVIPQAMRLVRQLASSLGAAHLRGIVHRDLKPENIILIKDGALDGGERAKILDFGIAKLGSDLSSQKTNASLVIGTPAYMSPEQCRGAGHVDQRSDVYSLGCVMFAALTGRPPFIADGGGELIALHLTQAPPRPSDIVTGIPPEIEAVVMKCLEKDASKRYGAGLDLAGVIGALLGTASGLGAEPRVSMSLIDTLGRAATPVRGVPITQPRDRLASEPTTMSHATGQTAAVAPPGESERKWIYASFAVVAAAAAAIAIILITKHDKKEPEVPAVAPPVIVDAPPPPPPVDAAPPPPPPIDPRAQVAPVIKLALDAFPAWAKRHAGAECPDATALGAPLDPWDKPLRITCTDQPAGQIIGAVSCGPDGKLDTADDIASWQLSYDVVAAVRGPRWVTKVKHTAPQHSTNPTRPPPVLLDENGIPIKR